MLTLGFTNVYYTLWSVTRTLRYGAGAVVNGQFTGVVYPVTIYAYQQNLSMDLEEAKKKIEAISAGKYDIDLTLRGDHGRWFERVGSPYKKMNDWQFSFGKLFTHDVRTSTDAWQLHRAMEQESNPRTRVYARRRLLELGELLRYDWTSSYRTLTHPEDPICDENVDVVKRHKYCSKRQHAWLEQRKAEAEISGHYFADGQRVCLKVKRIGGFKFESAYGTTHIEKYLTEDGKLVKYMGGNPPEISETEFVAIKGTAKHTNYKGVDETRLQRITLI